MLESLEKQGKDNIVSWQPHGRAFCIHDRDEFIGTILPKYFGTAKIESFQRQLNLYDFKRLSSGPDKHAYYHPCFLRGKQFLLRMIQRSTNKGVGVRLRPNPEDEPDFWDGPFPWVVQGRNEHDKEHQKRVASYARANKKEGKKEDSISTATMSVEAPVIDDCKKVPSGDSITINPLLPPLNLPIIDHLFVMPTSEPSNIFSFPADISLDNSVDIDYLDLGRPMSELFDIEDE
jgi:hypothetical protein